MKVGNKMAKFCPNCGAQMEDHVMFCAACGSQCSANPQPQQPAYQPMYQPPVTQARPPLQSSTNIGTLRIAVIVLAAIMLISLLLPLLTATAEYDRVLDRSSDVKILGGMTGEELANLNVFNFISILDDASTDFHYDGAQGFITVVNLLGFILAAAVLLTAIIKKHTLSIILAVPSIIAVNLGIVLMDFNPDAYNYGVGFFFFMMAAIATIVLSVICSKEDRKAKRMAYTQQWGMQ